jgi:RNA polymerase sigma-70 factor (ECF subfamily)
MPATARRGTRRRSSASLVSLKIAKRADALGKKAVAQLQPVTDEENQGKACQATARPAAEDVFRQHLPRVYSLARRMLDNETDVDDLVQEVLLQVVRKVDSFRGQAELTTWLHRVTINCVLLHRRRTAPFRSRQVRLPVEEVLDQVRRPGGKDRPEQLILARETQELIDLAITRLPEVYRHLFVLADIEGMANAEIGLALGLSLAAVKSRLHRARQLLRDALIPHFTEHQRE